MTQNFNNVKPGDLITADFINQLMVSLQDLDTRLKNIEGKSGQSVVITDILPPGTLRVGQEIRIIGQNFDFTVGAQGVFFNGAVALVKAISSDGQFQSNNSLLVVQVPQVPGLSETADTTVTVMVTNRSTTTTRQVALKPRLQNQQGKIVAGYKGYSPNPATKGIGVIVSYDVTSQALLAETLILAPTISNPEWLTAANTLTILDTDNGRLNLAPEEKKTVRVRLLQIPADTNATGFTIGLNLTAGQTDVVLPQPNPVEIPIGTATDPIDQNIHPSINTSIPGGIISRLNPTDQFDTVTVPGSGASIQLDLAFDAGGQYDYTVEIVPAGTNWQTRISTAPFFDPVPSPFTVTPPAEGQQEHVFPAIDIVTPTGAAPAAQVVVTVRNHAAGTTAKATLTLNLVKAI